MKKIVWSAPLVRLPLPGEREAVLMQDWTEVAAGWMIFIPSGTRTDGASIPRALWRICGHPLESPRVYAALVHDFLYSGGGPADVTRKDADTIYRELLVRYGWGRARSNIEYYALRFFGVSHWTKRKKGNK